MKERKGYYITDQYATYFLTFTIVGWVDIFARRQCRDMIIESLRYCQSNKGLVLNAYVIMSNHIHLIASAKPSSDGLSAIIRDFKKYTSKEIIKWINTSKKESRKEWLDVVFKYHAKFDKNNVHYKVWQGSNQPKLLLHPRFTRQKLNYIHNNPVTDGLVVRPEDYVYSSAADYSGRTDTLLAVEIIDFGVEEGYVLT